MEELIVALHMHTRYSDGSGLHKDLAEAGLDAGAKWFVVEQDASVGRTPLEAAAMSIDTLRKIGLKG